MIYLSMQPYEGHTLIEVNPTLIMSILDLILGGDGKVEVDPTRVITEVEQNLIEGFFQILTHDLQETWRPIVDVNFSQSPIETSPQMSGRFATTEAVVAIAIELRIGERVGMVNVAIPSITLKMMGQRFDQQWTVHKSENPATESAIKQRLSRELKVTVTCELAGMTMRIRDLMNLKPGDVFEAVAFENPMDLLINGSPKFKASVCARDNGRGAVVQGCYRP